MVRSLVGAVDQVLLERRESGNPLAVVLAGHNGSGKSTLWYRRLAGQLQIPLINADRMMLSVLPQVTDHEPLPPWAVKLRDHDESWMNVAQKGVEAFAAQAIAFQVPFAMETVFSHWKKLPSGKIESKIDLIKKFQKAGYFVVLLFVGLADKKLSIARVNTRIAEGGHAVSLDKLEARFPRTQIAIRNAIPVADASILIDNSLDESRAFSVCRVQIRGKEVFDVRSGGARVSDSVLQWLNVVASRVVGPSA